MRILFIGDIMGKPGRRLLAEMLPGVKKDLGGVDFVIANGENAAAGFGLTESVMRDLFAVGVDVLTGGNHIWDKKDFLEVLDAEPRVLRPANYPDPSPGRGWGVFESRAGRLAVVNLQGRTYLPPIDCPFQKADALLERIDTPCVLVDFHAEASSEKRALALYLDGRASAVVGTHTHVQTADEQILPRGTAFITDVGMTGGHGGVIGMTYESVLPRFLTGRPCKFEVCPSAPRFQALFLEIDAASGRTRECRRINFPFEEETTNQLR